MCLISAFSAIKVKLNNYQYRKGLYVHWRSQNTCFKNTEKNLNIDER